MTHFLLYGESIEFEGPQDFELELFRTIHSRVYPIIKKNIENNIVGVKVQKQRDKNYIDEADAHFDLMEERKEYFVESSTDVYNAITSILTDEEIYSFNSKRVKEDVETTLDWSFMNTYAPYHMDGNNLLKRANDYNQKLKNDMTFRQLFLAQLMLNITRDLLQIVITEKIAKENPIYDVTQLEFSNIFAFKDEEIDPEIYDNKVRMTRENIESIGLNERNKKVYIEQFQKDPFALSAYFFLAKELGDEEGNLNTLFEYVFGNDEVLQIYKINLVEEKVNQILPGYSKKMKNIIDLGELNAALEKIKEVKAYYQARFYLGVEIDLENRINKIERGELNESSEMEDKQEVGLLGKIGGYLIAFVIVLLVTMLLS